MNFLIVVTAKYFIALSILIFLYSFWKTVKEKRLDFILLSIHSFILSYVIAKISGYFIFDPRPFVVEHINPLIAHAANNGFPSDHMLLAMAMAAIVFVFNKKHGLLLTFVAVLIGAARVLAKIHHIEDILGSSVIAIIATYIPYLFLPTMHKMAKKNLPKNLLAHL